MALEREAGLERRPGRDLCEVGDLDLAETCALLAAARGLLPLAAGEGPRGVLHTALDEADLAAPLNQVVADFPGVEIGSYPRWQPDERGHLRCVVRLTFEAIGAQRHRAREARDALASALGSAAVLVDGPERL